MMRRDKKLLSPAKLAVIATVACVTAVFLFPTLACAQPTVPVDPQIAFQRSGINAIKAEKRRENRNPCALATAEAEMVACIAREYGLTQENYAAYMHSIGGLLRLKFKDDTGGTVLDVARGFETSEALWQRVRDLECAAAGDQSPGDHPAADQQCRLYLTRRHIYDLQALYPDLWSK